MQWETRNIKANQRWHRIFDTRFNEAPATKLWRLCHLCANIFGLMSGYKLTNCSLLKKYLMPADWNNTHTQSQPKRCKFRYNITKSVPKQNISTHCIIVFHCSQTIDLTDLTDLTDSPERTPFEGIKVLYDETEARWDEKTKHYHSKGLERPRVEDIT